MTQRRTLFLLVHGAWHGGWCWEPVAERLRAGGHDALAPDLPGRCGDGRPLGDLHADADAVRALLDANAGRHIVLVGHSYGGAVITDAGRHAAVARLVYVAAFVPSREETLGELAWRGNTPEELLRGFDIDVTNGLSTIRPDEAIERFYNDVPGEAAAAAAAQLSPHNITAGAQSVRDCSWEDKPSIYVLCTDDRAIKPELQRDFASRAGADIVEMRCGHSPFLVDPDGMADVLAGMSRPQDTGQPTSFLVP
jgi:pimeloyl-ACP methyl ester carboxylesterase